MFFKYTHKKLVADIRRLLDDAIGPHILDYDAERSLVTIAFQDEQPDAVINLTNIFNKLKDFKKSERLETLGDFLKTVFEEKPLTQDQLIQSLTLRARTQHDLYVREQHMRPHVDDYQKPIVFGDGDLVLELCIDGEQTVQSADEETLKKHNISIEEAWAIASANVNRLTDSSQWEPFEGEIWYSSYQDDYDFSRIVVAGENAILPIKQNAIIFAPSHSICLVCSADKPQEIERMIEVGSEYAKEHRPLSQRLWALGADGVLQDWSSQNMVLEVCERQVLIEQGDNYDDQKQLLEQALEAREEDSFVASYQVFKNDGVYRTLSVYTIDLPTYLPRTDVVAIVEVDSSGESVAIGELAWDSFIELMGEQLRMLDDGPERYSLLGELSAPKKAKLLQALNH